MKKIIIIAGPNGAGKTTFAEEFLPQEANCREFVNADLIALGLSPFNREEVSIAAGRLMLARIRELVSQGASFAFETTLASRSFAYMIPHWQNRGYRVCLCFLQLPDADFAVRRVAERVRFRGHSIPEPVVRRRFDRGSTNLENLYLKRVDEWAIYDSTTSPAHLVSSGVNRPDQTLMEEAAKYHGKSRQESVNQLPEDSVLRGADAAFKRAGERAVARARAAGLEPVIRKLEDIYPER